MGEDEVMDQEMVQEISACEGDSSVDEFASIRKHYEEGTELTNDEMDAIADLAVGYLKGILSLFGETSSSIDEYDGDNGELILDINGGDLAVLIGRHGRTLDALQMVLTSLMSCRTKFYYPIVVDIEGYKSRRKKKIESIALNSAARAQRQGSKVVLPPMKAFERRLVHLALLGDDSVTTHSEGVEPERYVVITPVH